MPPPSTSLLLLCLLLVSGTEVSRTSLPDPSSEESLATLVSSAAALARQNNLAAAEDRLRRAISLSHGKHPVPLLNLGILLLDDPARNADALDVLERARRLRPRHAPTLSSLALGYEAANRTKKARQLYTKALASDPRDVRLMFNLGQLLFRSHPSKSIKLLTRALQVSKEAAVVSQHGESRPVAGSAQGEAQGEAQGARPADGADGGLLRRRITRTLAAFQAERGQFATAAELLEELLLLQPQDIATSAGSDSALLYHLASLHDSAGNVDRAVHFYRRVLLLADGPAKDTGAEEARSIAPYSLGGSSQQTLVRRRQQELSAVNLGVLLYRRGGQQGGDARDAARLFARVLEQSPSNDIAFHNLILLVDNDAWSDAAKHLKTLIAGLSTNSSDHHDDDVQTAGQGSASTTNACRRAAADDAGAKLDAISEVSRDEQTRTWAANISEQYARIRATVVMSQEPASRKSSVLDALAATVLRYHCCRLGEAREMLETLLLEQPTSFESNSPSRRFVAIQLALTSLRQYLEDPDPVHASKHLSTIGEQLFSSSDDENDDDDDTTGMPNSKDSKDLSADSGSGGGLLALPPLLKDDSERILKAIVRSARFRAKGLGTTTTTTSASSNTVRNLFEQYADSFDEELVGTLEYQAPEHLYQVVKPFLANRFDLGSSACGDLLTDAKGAMPPSSQSSSSTALCRRRRKIALLDLGCGTGLAALPFQNITRRLVGVDISPRMIDQARQRQLYDELVNSNAMDYLSSRARSATTMSNNLFDVAIMSDTLPYFGPIDKLLHALNRVLRSGGLVAFTVESAGEQEEGREEQKRKKAAAAAAAAAAEGFMLDPDTKRYRHRQQYIRQAAFQAGFLALHMETRPLRREAGKLLLGHYVVLQRRL